MFHLEKISFLLVLGSILSGFCNECFRVMQLLTVRKSQCTDHRELSEVGVIICKVNQVWIIKYLLVSFSLTFQVGGGKVEVLMLSTGVWKGNATGS